MDDGIRDEIQSMIEDALENMVCELRDEISECVEEAVNDNISEIMIEALETFFTSHTFALSDGTIIQPKEHLKVLSPDNRKLLPCYGGNPVAIFGRPLFEYRYRFHLRQRICRFDRPQEWHA